MPPKTVRTGFVLAALAMLPSQVTAEFDWTGHVKARLLSEHFDDGSVFRQSGDAAFVDAESDLRLNFAYSASPWKLDAAWQLLAGVGDATGLRLAAGDNPGAFEVPDRDDGRRLWNLADNLYTGSRSEWRHRVDRLTVSRVGERSVIRLGRQALTWGNGLYFAPLDIVNPFDPAAIDTEYKAGDDMLYAQYLRGNGDDIEAAVVFRRDPLTGDASADERTLAFRYNHHGNDTQYSVLLASSYGDPLLGFGWNRSVGGAVWRTDVAVSDDGGWTAQLVTNLNYSWQWSDKNVTGSLEYYFNGFGASGGNYDANDLAAEPRLLARLARGQTFTVGRNYLAGGLTVEMSPLWLVSPNLFVNLDDGSALLQLGVQHSLGNNLSFLAAVDVPLGPQGSEFGGLEVAFPNRYLSYEASVFAQLGWYF